jgi:hypothetical protein
MRKRAAVSLKRFRFSWDGGSSSSALTSAKFCGPPASSLSKSSPQDEAMLGEQSDKVLRELGHGAATISDLNACGITRPFRNCVVFTPTPLVRLNSQS